MPLTISIEEHHKDEQDVESIGLGDVSFLEPLARFDPYGAWRLDIESGFVYWTRDVFLIHGMEPKNGPVDVVAAINAYHPEDRPVVAECIEEAVAKKSGYRFVLRLVDAAGAEKLVKSTAQYRVNGEGKEELYGTFSMFQKPLRAVSVGEVPDS